MRGAVNLLRLLRSQWDSPAALRQRQSRELVRLVHHAYARVPYYRRLFDAAGLSPGEIRGLDDLRRIPLTSKQDLQRGPPGDTTARGTDPALCRRSRTSGATGVPLEIVLSRADGAWMNPSFLRVHIAWGVRPWHRLASFEARPESCRWTSWYEPLGFFRRRRVSTREDPSRWVEQVAAWQPRLLQGYALTLKLFAEAVAETGGGRLHVPLIASTSGLLDAAGRNRLAGVLGGRVVDIYASEEAGGTIAWECPSCGAYHISEDRLIVEFLCDGRPAQPGEEGEVVITNLGNRTMPFIRYRQGDRAVPSARRPVCGRHLALMESVMGREGDFVVLASGRRLTPHPFFLVLDHAVGVGEWRLTQTHLTRFEVEVTACKVAGTVSADAIGSEIRALVGPEADVRVAVVDRVRRDPSRKLRSVVSLVTAPDAGAL